MKAAGAESHSGTPQPLIGGRPDHQPGRCRTCGTWAPLQAVGVNGPLQCGPCRRGEGVSSTEHPYRPGAADE